jgi:copper(I)-binding protein
VRTWQWQNAREDTIMLGRYGSPGREPMPRRGRRPRPGRDIARAACVAGALLTAAAAVAGCAPGTGALPPIQLGTAYVEVPADAGSTDAYLVIQNNGAADRLISARTSVGGRVIFEAPRRLGSSLVRSVPDIAIPSRATVRLVPGGSYLVITGAGPMHSGGQIRLTLVFAKAGTMSVWAEVTNPETGGSSYLLN